MAITSVATGNDLTVEQWSDMAFREYVAKLVLKPYMGTSPESVIHVDEDTLKDIGDAVTFGLVSALQGEGVEGDSVMEGNEEELQMYGHRVEIDELKNAVLLGGSMSRRRTKFDQKMEAKAALTTWLAQKIEDKAFRAMASINGVTYGSATEAQKDGWLDSNIDRALFGDAVSNLDTSGGTVAADHSDSLAAIDSTNDILDTDQISLAKRIAQLADPKIRPIKIENGEEYYVMFVHPYCARDLKASSAWQQAQREAQARGTNNPIFTGMLGMWDGVILKESTKITLLDGVGASSADVAINVLCGAQALLMAHGGFENGVKVEMVEKMFDYNKKPGFQISTIFGVEKAVFNSKQHGIVSVHSAAVAD